MMGESASVGRGCALGLLALLGVGCSSIAGALRGEGSSEHGDTRPALGAHGSSLEPASSEGEAEVGPRLSLLPLSRSELWAAWNSMRGDAYELDSVERFLEEGSRPACKPESLVRHSGNHLRYRGAVRIDPAFRDRLVRFEQVVVEVAEEMYGRAPTRVLHFGAFSCRSSRNRSHRLSEHALGNAIDVSGFEFGRASAKQPLPVDAPSQLRRPFEVRVARHWKAGANENPVSAAHARFLHELATRLSERSDVFRGMIGPSRRDHADHFHFDMSPWRYVYF
jgi:hypothetical protein